MLRALSRGDGPTFLALAREHEVSFVLHRRAHEGGLDLRALPFLVEDLRVEYVTLYRLDLGRPAGTAAPHGS